jgi:hypothetical protein
MLNSARRERNRLGGLGQIGGFDVGVSRDRLERFRRWLNRL